MIAHRIDIPHDVCLPERVVLNADLVSAESFTDSFHFLLFRRARRVCYCAAAVVP